MDTSTSSIFSIDTKSICLLCLKDCKLYGSFGSNKVRQEIGSCTRSVSFNLLLRYLNINLFKLCQFPPGFMQSMDVTENAEADIMISLCESCNILLKSLSNLYEKMEEIRLQIDVCVQSLQQVMTYGESQKERVEEYQRRRRSQNLMEMLIANVAEQLRKEIMLKCSIKVRSTLPKISLYKRDAATKDSFDVHLSSSPINNGEKESGPKCNTGNYKFHRFLKPYDHSTLDNGDTEKNKLFGKLTNKQSKSTGGGKRAYRSRQNNKPTLELDLDGGNNLETNAISGEEVIVKVEPSTLSSYHNEDEDPLEPEPIPVPISFAEYIEIDDKKPVRHATGKYPCIDCNMKFERPSILWKHQLVYHSNTISRRAVTGKKAQGKRGFPKVISLQGRKKRIRCKCNKFFASKASLAVHIRKRRCTLVVPTVSPTAKKGGGRGRATQSFGAFRCEFCEKWFKNRQVFQTHQISIHSLHVYKEKLPKETTEQQLNCAIKKACSEYKSYPDDPSKKIYGCPYCVSQFPHPSHLRLHIIRRHFMKIVEKVSNCKGLEEEENGTEFDVGPGFEIEFETEDMTEMEENEDNLLYQVEYEIDGDNINEVVVGGDGGGYVGQVGEMFEECEEEENNVNGDLDENYEENDMILVSGESNNMNGFILGEVVMTEEDEQDEELNNGEEEGQSQELEAVDQEVDQQEEEKDNEEDEEQNNDADDDDDMPPILMKQTYSLSETVIEEAENKERSMDNLQSAEDVPIHQKTGSCI